MAKRTTLYRYLTGPDDAAFCHRVGARSAKVGTTFAIRTRSHDSITREFFSFARNRANGKRARALSRGWSLYGQPTLAFDATQGRVICGQAIIKDVDEPYAPTLKLSEQ